jgi:Ca2+-binding RTX toxin-like protein
MSTLGRIATISRHGRLAAAREYDVAVKSWGWWLSLVVILAGIAVFATDDAGAGSAAEENPRCHGRKATIVGTDGDDVLRGTDKPDVIVGGGGNDVIYAGLGNDIVCAGPGDDLVHGGRGNDLLDGGAGSDRVFGDLGDDKAMGGGGDEDEVSGGLGIDTVSGGPGNRDLVRGDYGYDRMDGGPGQGDVASFATAVAGGKGTGVWASLRAHKARGDGHDRLFRFESLEGSAFADTLIGNGKGNTIDGGPGNDHLVGGGGPDTLEGGQGKDACAGGAVHTSCGPEAPPKGSALVRLDADPAGGGGLQVVGGGGSDHLVVAFDEPSSIFLVTSNGAGLANGAGCEHVEADPKRVACPAGGPGRWMMVDLGPGNDSLSVFGSLAAVDFVRLAGGEGDDRIHGGPEDDLIESGPGADKIWGEAGEDGLIGGLPGPTYLYGGEGGDLLAAGGGCAGGALVGGPGRDDASFAETQAHPGTLYVSLAKGAAWIDVVKNCRPVGLSRSDEDIEGSFDNDVLIGDAGPNLLLGQPGEDEFFGHGGEDTIVAADGVKDGTIQCARPGHRREGRAIVDPIDPAPEGCAVVSEGTPVAGLHK